MALLTMVFGDALPENVANKIKQAEMIRDKTVHGKSLTRPEKREAMVDVLDYAEEISAHLEGKADFEPSGDLGGSKGRAKPLDKSTTRWLLKAMGFGIA